MVTSEGGLIVNAVLCGRLGKQLKSEQRLCKDGLW